MDSGDPPQWEYHVEIIDRDSLASPTTIKRQIERRLNELGEMGWQLVSALDRRDEYGRSSIEYTLKRPRTG